MTIVVHVINLEKTFFVVHQRISIMKFYNNIKSTLTKQLLKGKLTKKILKKLVCLRNLNNKLLALIGHKIGKFQNLELSQVKHIFNQNKILA